MHGSSSAALKCQDNCDGCSTTSVTCYEDLSTHLDAIVSVLPPNTQSFSYVSTEYFVDLGYSDFTNLTELKILNITLNDTMANGEFKISKSVLAPLANLQILKIHLLWFFDEPLDDLFEPLVNLEELDLSQTRAINITILRRVLYGLSNSTTLKTINLSNIQGTRLPICLTLNLTWFLEPLQNCPIRHLHLANNYLQSIYPGIIQYTPLLEYIDVSYNQLIDPYCMLFPSKFILEIFLHKELQEVDYSYQGPPIEEQTHGVFGSNPRFPDQERFDPDDDISEHWWQCIETLMTETCEVFRPNCSDTIDNLRRNHSRFCELMYSFDIFDREIPCSALPAFDDLYQKHCHFCRVYPIMGSIKRLKFRDGHTYNKEFNRIYTPKHTNLCFHQSNQLEYLDLSGNAYLAQGRFRVANYQQTSITGLIHMKVLNVSNTGITSVSDNMLLSFPNLQVMDLSRNNIVFYREKPMSLITNREIQFLNFAHNQISFVPPTLFSNLMSLRKLDLSHNHIHDFDFNINELYSLENLNVENNMISEIPEATREQLIQLTEHITPRVITVDLSNNQLACSCSNFPCLSFMSQTKPTNLMFKNYNEYFCINQDNDRVHMHHLSLHSMWFDCLGSGVYTGIGFGGACVVITMILLLAVIIYRKRWWFRYQYFLAHRVWQNYNKIATFDTPFEYDLFVSYNRSDYQWVDEVLQPKLEDELGLRLCLHHRDFRLGEVITEQIIESVQSSKKTLFVLSKSFLASTWCHFEIQMAQSRLFTTGKDVILLALLEPLPDRMVSKTLKGLLETRTYVEWTENDTYGQKLFWEKLYESVKAPITQPFDLENRPLACSIQREDSGDPSSEEASREREPLLASSRSELSESWHEVQVNA